MEVAPPTQPRTRLLFVITKANWGGAQKNVYDLATAAERDGYEVMVACGSKGEMSTRLQKEGILVQVVPGLARDVSLTGDIRALLSLNRLCRYFKPDIVHAHSSKAGLLATLAARFSGVRHIIFTAHGWAFNESRPFWQKIVFATFHVITIYAAHTVICVSKSVKEDILWVPMRSGKCVVIHNGIAPSTLTPRIQARALLAPTVVQTQWIGTLAELHPTKGLDVAIRAFARIASEFPESALILIGEGEQREYLQNVVHELSLEDRVHFCGHISGAPDLLLALDIFVFPSRSEALGYAALEAGVAGLAVVASRVGGIPEIITDGVSGILVPPGDIRGFTEGMRTLVGQPDLRNEYGEALRSTVRTEFSEEKMIGETLRIYKK